MNIKILDNKKETNNIWMFHRIQTPHNKISNIYKKRSMVHTIDELYHLIDKAIKEGYSFGSIAEAIHSKKTIHLTFDDGYKEHLYVAKELKKRYNLPYNSITFSINIRNSFYSNKLCMDIVYQLIDNHSLNKINSILNIKSENIEIKKIKKIIFSTKEYINQLNQFVNLKNYFLNQEEVVKLSKLFRIASHAENHCYLTALHKNDIYQELEKSKKYLSNLLNIEIDTICFPEGDHSDEINAIAKEIGYKFGLAISSSNKQPKEFSLERVIP